MYLCAEGKFQSGFFFAILSCKVVVIILLCPFRVNFSHTILMDFDNELWSWSMIYFIAIEVDRSDFFFSANFVLFVAAVRLVFRFGRLTWIQEKDYEMPLTHSCFESQDLKFFALILRIKIKNIIRNRILTWLWIRLRIRIGVIMIF